MTSPPVPRMTTPARLVLDALNTSSTALYGRQLLHATGLKSGTLYPLLRRLEHAGLITSEDEHGHHPGRPARRYYQLAGANKQTPAEPWHRSMPGDDLTGRTQHRWHVEGWENDEWGMVASPSDTLADARRKQGHVASRAPGLRTRIVRETVAYTVEQP